ncbi:molecular chaperone DjlA [Vibrio sp. UCD-FRSSP16_10]|uniref:co-chaperone DjlA n=1 Tax=unclassified Vibrio TaxID=2614977 RepID=UPI0007FBA454|nr:MULTISPECIES: co-chaperone DjlA [unclassified Vibrio]OBT16774.1 molecular chaperone DjlA [Vibrio sp. UCD-FRSSP16_30]OBT21401.1 molecular chaperone DjlA [Vibrio sp. UCD-FRSSP16_10]
MHFFGKILGAFFGFLFGGPVGALIGMYIGHRFDRAKTISQARRGGFGGYQRTANPAQQAEFFQAAFSVMGHVSKAKGKVTQEDIQLASIMMQRMNLDESQRQVAQAAFREGKSSSFPLRDVLNRVKEVSSGRRDLIQFFLELQISAAFADGSIHPNERDVLHIVAEVLGFNAAQLERRLKMQEAAYRFQQSGGHGGQYSGGGYQQQATTQDQLAAAYAILGVEATAEPKEIKRAYRKLMNEHHPDKLSAKGLPPEMLEVAKEKAQEIQNAYDVVKKERGFK